MLKSFKTLAKDWVENKQRRLPKSQNVKALTMCGGCYAFYYNHSWHFQKPKYLREDFEEEGVPVMFVKCTACLEQEDAMYERELNLILG